MTSTDFRNYLASLPQTWGSHMLAGEIQRTRSILKWAAEDGIISHLPNFGTDFRKPKKEDHRREATQRQKQRGGKLDFSADEIRTMLEQSSNWLKACILLGINGGMGNADRGRLSTQFFDVNSGWYDLPHEKTGIVMARILVDELRRAAAGHWESILQSVCGLTADQLNPRRHGPCPQCGGTNRSRAHDDVAETGGFFCNQCHNGGTNPKSSDGFAAVQWLRKCTFPESLQLLVPAIEFRSSDQSKNGKKHQWFNHLARQSNSPRTKSRIPFGIVGVKQPGPNLPSQTCSQIGLITSQGFGSKQFSIQP